MGYGTLIQRIVYKISGRVLASSGLYVPSDIQYDYALGGIPFLSAASDTRPDIEGPIEQRKQQFDNYKDPGEYSLNQWWLRSQTSFIGGTGVVYQDPDTQGAAKNIRYAHSIGVDPFTDPDNLQLLKETEILPVDDDTVPVGNMFLGAFTQQGSDWIWRAKGRTVYLGTAAPGTITPYDDVTLTGAGNDRQTGGLATFAQGSILFGANTEYAVTYLASSSAASAGLWRTANGFPSMNTTRIYVAPADALYLQRSTVAHARGLIGFGLNEKLYMLDPYVGANTALPASPNATVPIDQAIVAIVDGPDAVYVAANSSNTGYIYKTTFDNTTGLVNGLTLTAVLPAGELVNAMNAYVNTYLVISTTTGIRVGSFTGDGIKYSPSIITVPRLGSLNGPDAMSGFGRISFYGTQAYVCTQGTPQHDGVFGLMAIDLGVLIQDDNTGASFNAYSTWTYYPGTATAIDDVVATPSGRLVSSTGVGVDARAMITHATTLIQQGYLDTGRCRFNTIEPKLFKYFSIRTPTPLGGDITVSVLDQGGGITSYITYGPSLDPGTDDISTPIPSGPQMWLALRFLLKRNVTDPSIGAELDSWQIKALPGTLKQRKIIRQFLCFNSDKDKTGQTISGDTLALDNLTAVRQMCQRGDTVTLQDLTNNISTQVVIDDYQFTMLTTPGPNSENYGGYLTVTMRTVADSVPPISFAGVEEDE